MYALLYLLRQTGSNFWSKPFATDLAHRTARMEELNLAFAGPLNLTCMVMICCLRQILADLQACVCQVGMMDLYTYVIMETYPSLKT